MANVAQYVFEGEGWRAYRQDSEETTPLYRFYNEDTANHFYTTSEEERVRLIRLGEYAYEGVVGYVIG